MNIKESSVFDLNELVDGHYKLKRLHIDVLQELNPDNAAQALRFIIDEYLKNKYRDMSEKYLTLFAIGLVLFGLGITFSNIYVQIIMYVVSGIMICYSFYRYMQERSKFRKQIKGGKKDGEMEARV